MRGAILKILAGSALAIGATAANASITVNSCSAALDSCTADNTLAPAKASIAFSDAGPLTNPFSDFINFTNTLTGNYLISLNTADPVTWFDTLTIDIFGGGNVYTYSGPSFQSITFLPAGGLAAGQYVLTLGGHTTGPGGNLSGTLSFTSVPEPATWGLMLLGFGAIGISMRRRRNTALAQLA